MPQRFQEEGRPSESAICLAFPLRGSPPGAEAKEEEEEGGAHSLYAHLPIKSVGLPFPVHADFDLTASRTDLHRNPWNRWLRDAIADACLAALQATPRLAARTRAYLPPGLRLPDPEWQPLLDRLLRGLRDADTASTPAHNGTFDLKIATMARSI